MATLSVNHGSANTATTDDQVNLDKAIKTGEDRLEQFAAAVPMNHQLVTFVVYLNLVSSRLMSWFMSNVHAFGEDDQGRLTYNGQVLSADFANVGAPTPATPAAALPGGPAGNTTPPNQGASGLPAEAIQVWAIANQFHQQYGDPNSTADRTLASLLLPIEQIIQANGGNAALVGTYLGRMAGTALLRIRPDGRLEVEHLYDDNRAKLTAAEAKYRPFETMDQNLGHRSVTAAEKALRLTRMAAIANGDPDPLIEQLQRDLATARRRVVTLEAFIRYLGSKFGTITKVTRPSSGRLNQPDTADVRVLEESSLHANDLPKIADPAANIATPAAPTP